MYPDTQLYIDGAWSAAASGRTHPVVNPATGEVIGKFAWAERADLDRALAAAVRLRRGHVRLYQAISRVFTPVYQSDSRVLPWLRDNWWAGLALLGGIILLAVLLNLLPRNRAPRNSGQETPTAPQPPPA